MESLTILMFLLSAIVILTFVNITCAIRMISTRRQIQELIDDIGIIVHAERRMREADQYLTRNPAQFSNAPQPEIIGSASSYDELARW